MYTRVTALKLVEYHEGWDTRWPRKPMPHAVEAFVEELMRHAGKLHVITYINDVVVACSAE